MDYSYCCDLLELIFFYGLIGYKLVGKSYKFLSESLL